MLTAFQFTDSNIGGNRLCIFLNIRVIVVGGSLPEPLSKQTLTDTVTISAFDIIALGRSCPGGVKAGVPNIRPARSFDQ